MVNKSDWYLIDEGQTLGSKGSESGIIILDEEYVQGARITLEQCDFPPFAITCGIYGWTAHTTFAGSKDEALKKIEVMKKMLEEISGLNLYHRDLDLEAKREKLVKTITTFVNEF